MRFSTLINKTSSFYMSKNEILLQIFHLFVCLLANRVTKRIDRFDSSNMCNSTMVSLSAYLRNNNDNAEECSGTLVSERHILTSASCVQNRDGELYDKVNVILRPCSSIIINRTVLRNGILSHKDYNYTHTAQLCTVPKGLVPSDTEESCQRHSGGPILVNRTQIGIKSYGSGKCEEAAIYTRVSAYVNSGWILEKMVL